MDIIGAIKSALDWAVVIIGICTFIGFWLGFMCLFAGILQGLFNYSHVLGYIFLLFGGVTTMVLFAGSIVGVSKLVDKWGVE